MQELRKFLSSSQDNFQQQTFLGCTVRDFNVNGGFGDSVSTLNVQLVPDEYNRSDCYPIGYGDDTYHNGLRDKFDPPLPGSPVFFKFGPTFSSIKKAWMPEYNFIYGTDIKVVEDPYANICPSSVPIEDCAGLLSQIPKSGIANHYIFGGILQSYGTNSSTGGDPVYNVTINDPREILSNVTLILGNYANTVFNLPNMLNIYGFLEYNPSETLRTALDSFYPPPYIFRKDLSPNGITYTNGLRNMPLLTDAYTTPSFLQALTPNLIQTRFVKLGDFPHIFPYTGTSYSRRSETGIPVYRIVQAIYALMGFFGPLPLEYRLKNFGGMINFRGYNYIVDLSGIPFHRLPVSYFIDFDQMNLLEFCQEVCDAISHDLHVTLLPIIDDHPVTKNIDKKLVAGIIRINAIDRSHKPNYGAITNFINYQKSLGINVTSTDVGFELSNIPTDKFIVGAQEVNMHYFTGNEDRHKLATRKFNYGLNFHQYNSSIPEQWFISNSLRQQILPFYGFLGKDAVTIPRGYGPYQQILLDSTGLNVNGVGNYYVATEMELRAALISYEEWKSFLLQYNDLYMEEVADNSQGMPVPKDPPNLKLKHIYLANKKYAVGVPRCVFRSDRNYFINGQPASSCSPPYGWPLYYKRAEMIGIPDKGLSGFMASNAAIISSTFKISDSRQNFNEDTITTEMIDDMKKDYHKMSEEDRAIVDLIETNRNNPEIVLNILENVQKHKDKQVVPSLQLKRRSANAMKVYEFVKQAAQNLGTKWLVKIPKVSNPYYAGITALKGGSHRQARVFEIEYGPYGFIPRDVLGNISSANLDPVRSSINNDIYTTILSYGAEDSAYYTLKKRPITEGIPIDITQGALKVNYDYIKESYVFNYEPEPQGGYLHNDLYQNLISSAIYSDANWNEFRKNDSENYPLALRGTLLPLDPTPLMNENRISTYVRYDNSQYLDLSSLPKDSYAQMEIKYDNVMPDILLDLDNEYQDRLLVEGDTDLIRQNRPKTCVFIKCELDPRFYMPPRYRIGNGPFQGDIVKDEGFLQPGVSRYDKVTGKDYKEFPTYIPNFVPVASGGNEVTEVSGNYVGSGPDLKFIPVTETRNRYCLQEDFERYYDEVLQGEIVLTDPLNQDTNHVYALITLPGFVGTIIDRKFEQAKDDSKRKDALLHMLLQDVVSSQVPGFNYPPVKTRNDIIKSNLETKSITPASYNPVMESTSLDPENWKTQATRENYALALPLQSRNVQFPSPVMPDLVAIPLLSKERCYGPWISSFTRSEASEYRNVPGKIEFIKDENLAPWNYGGYDLMNQAGLSFTEFTSSLLLYEERGSITISDIPRGNSLLKPLIDGGPIVTNIDVRIGSDGITTTFNMSTYSPRFGNLQKQRNDMISKISRDRQRLLDDRNEYIRRGLSKLRGNYSDREFLGLNAVAKIAHNIENSIDKSKYQETVNISNGETITQTTDFSKEQPSAVVKEDAKRDTPVKIGNSNVTGPASSDVSVPPTREKFRG